MANSMEVDTFLPPIEKPQGLIMRLAFYFTRRQFGKVLTPLKVHSARLPSAFGLFYSKISNLDKKLLLHIAGDRPVPANIHYQCIARHFRTSTRTSILDARNRHDGGPPLFFENLLSGTSRTRGLLRLPYESANNQR